MSNIAIQGAATGTGVFTLASPATNTNRTLTLPDEAGTVLTSASGVAKTGDTMTGVLTIQNAGFDSRITLQNTGTGGQTFNVFSTMDSFTQGGGNLLFHTSSAPNGILKMDSAGRVTMPYQPAFSAKNSASLTINTTGGDFLVPYNEIITNRGNHYNNSTYRFTAPVAGFYFFSADIQVTGTITDYTYFFIRFHVNGSDISQEKMMPKPSGGAYATQAVTMGIYLNVNDYVEAIVRQAGGTTLTIRADQRNFSGFLVG
jgi:hypothetical protein